MKNFIFTFALLSLVMTTLEAADYYWVGGSGNWNDASKWSLTSGGAGGAGVPTTADNVFFDAASFTTTGQKVTINVNAVCADMNWTGALFSPELARDGTTTRTLSIYGSLTLINEMNFNFLGTIYFESLNTGKTITCSGQTFKRDIYFQGVGGYILQDTFAITGNYSINFIRGTLDLNNQPITVYRFISDNSNVRFLSFGSSVLTITNGNHAAMSFNGTNMTLNAGTSLIRFTGANGGMYNLSGGGLAFYDVICEAITGTGYARNLNGSFNTVVFNSDGNVSYSNIIDSLTCAGNLSINNNNNNFNYLSVNGKATIAGDGTYNIINLNGNADITGSNTITSLLLSAGKSYTLTNTKTQLITNSLTANGTCAAPITIQSNTTSQTTISKATGSISISYCVLQGINGSGGASFTALNTVDFGNNSGWSITQPTPQNLYWIGGSGNWNDPSKWSQTSGGTPGLCIPNALDNVFFDANSFNAASQTVTIIGDQDGKAFCKNMTWTGATNNPTLGGTNAHTLYIFGSLTLIPGMTYNFNGEVNFLSTNTGNTITSAGKALDKAHVRFNGEGGEWTLADAFSTGSKYLYFVRGSLITNNNPLTVYSFYSNYTHSRSLTLGSSVVTITYGSHSAMEIHGLNMTLNAGTSLIKFTGINGGMYNLYGGGLNFYDVICEAATGTGYARNLNGSFNSVVFNSDGNITYTNTINSVTCAGNLSINSNNNNITTLVVNGTASIAGETGVYGHATLNGNGTITGSNTFGTLIFTAGKQYTLTGNKTQTITDNLVANGTETQLIIMKSSSVGTQTTISKSSGTVTVEYVSLQDNKATGGATFIANNSLDLGNNTGWNIIAPGGKDYYWVGNTGNWNDASKWSLTSGGAGGAGVPTAIDNVFFDANSFTTSGQTVTIIGDVSNNARIVNLDWTGVTNNPTLAGANTQTLRIGGSMTLSPNITYNFLGPIIFDATLPGQTVTTAGLALNKNSLTFNGVGGGWTLLDGLNIGSQVLFLENGSLNTNGQAVNAGRFDSWYSGNIRALTLGSSVITLTSTSHQTVYFHGTGMTLDAGTSLIKLTGSTAGFYNLSGGGLFFYDLICEATTGNVNIYNLNGGFNNIEFKSAGTSNLRYSNTVNSVIFSGTGGIHDIGNNINTVVFNGQGTINSNGTYGHVTMNGNGIINGSNTFGTLIFTAGNQYTLTFNQTQTITSNLVAEGADGQVIVIKSSSTGNQTTISKAIGTVTVNYVSLQDNKAMGGATFVANNSIDLGNNAGWTINAPGGKDYYWVGGTGDWNDASKWSLTSGGAGGAGTPTVLDNVFFDANSFTAPGQTVTIIGDASNNARVINMDWTGVTNNPTLAGANTQTLHIGGSMTLSPNLTYNFLGPIIFNATLPGQNVFTAGIALNKNTMTFNGVGGSWTLLDGLNIGSQVLFLENGSLNTNDQAVNAGRFDSWYSGNIRALTLGSSVITLTSTSHQTVYFHGTGMTLDAGTSLIKLTGSTAGFYNLSGGGLFFYDLICEATTGNVNIYNLNGGFNNITFNSSGTNSLLYGNVVNNIYFNGLGRIYDDNTITNAVFYGDGSIHDNNTFGTLNFSPGKTYTLTYNKTQTILNELNAEGTCAASITIQSSSATFQTTLSKASGTVSVSHCNLQQINTTGGAIFIAENCVDLGGNSGWTFSNIPQDLYWVGGIGNWDDVSHWSATSGGPGNYCTPGQLDNVIFDQNSFTQTGQYVLINVANADCRDMDWSAATFAPTFTSSSASNNLNIYGSLTLSPNMNFAFSGKVYFLGTTTSKAPYTITSAGRNFNNAVYFNASDGIWNLLDAFSISSNDLYLERGTLNTNDQTVAIRRFYSNNNNVRALNLGSSVVNLNSNSYQAWLVTGTNLTLDAGTSEINLTSANGGFQSTGSPSLTYNNLTFQNPGGASTLNSDDVFNAVTFYPSGLITGGGTYASVLFNGTADLNQNSNYGSVTMQGNANIKASNIFSRLTFNPGNTYIFESGSTQTISGRFLIWGTAANPINIQSSVSGAQATITKPTGTVLGNYIQLKDMNGTGGATYNLYSSTDLGNNIGWNFLAPTSLSFQNVTITPGPGACHEATETITLGGSGTTFIVQNGGNFKAIAGYKVSILTGTRVYSGGHLHAMVTQYGLFCDTLSTMLASEPVKENVGQSFLYPGNNNSFINTWPNPTAGILNVELSEPTGIYIFELYGMMGERLLTSELSGQKSWQIDMSPLPQGVYLVRVYHGNHVETVRIVRH